eukprot:5483727-Pyramimonas_sp.AAC.1
MKWFGVSRLPCNYKLAERRVSNFGNNRLEGQKGWRYSPSTTPGCWTRTTLSSLMLFGVMRTCLGSFTAGNMALRLDCSAALCPLRRLFPKVTTVSLCARDDVTKPGSSHTCRCHSEEYVKRICPGHDPTARVEREYTQVASQSRASRENTLFARLTRPSCLLGSTRTYMASVNNWWEN